MSEKWCAIESYELTELVAATVHVAARADLTRRVLTLRFGELGLTVEAANTDLQVTKHCQAESTFTDTRVVPAKLFADVVKALPAGRVLLEPEEEALTVSSGTAKFIIPTPNVELPGFSVEGEPVGAGSQKLVDGINRVAFAASSASEITRSIALTGVLVVGRDHNTGESEERVEAEISGEFLEVGYNPGFLLDGLRACRSEQVELGLNDNQRPTIVSGVGDEGFRYVLMPVRF